MTRGFPLTAEERQEIIDTRLAGHTYQDVATITGRPYNTVAHILRDAGLQKERDEVILIVCDPRGIFKSGPTEFNQADLIGILTLAAPADGFSFSIGKHLVTTHKGVYIRDDGYQCFPNLSSAFRWTKPKGVE